MPNWVQYIVLLVNTYYHEISNQVQPFWKQAEAEFLERLQNNTGCNIRPNDSRLDVLIYLIVDMSFSFGFTLTGRALLFSAIDCVQAANKSHTLNGLIKSYVALLRWHNEVCTVHSSRLTVSFYEVPTQNGKKKKRKKRKPHICRPVRMLHVYCGIGAERLQSTTDLGPFAIWTGCTSLSSRNHGMAEERIHTVSYVGQWAVALQEGICAGA